MSVTAITCAILTLAAWVRGADRRNVGSPIEWPALAWWGAMALSALFGLDRSGSLARLRKGLFPGLVPIAAFHTAGKRSGTQALGLLFLSSTLASVFGLVVFILEGGGMAARARGLSGHYMTYGGQLLLVVSLCAGIVMVGRTGPWRWAAATTALAGTAALAATYTRSAWIGLSVALGVVFAGTRPRWLIGLMLLLAGIYVFAPGDYRERVHSAFDPHHPSNLERTYMWQSGVRMFLDHPLIGVGLQDLMPLYERYRMPQARERVGHLHNIVVQIAASMGIVGLVTFVILYRALFVTATSGLRPMLRAGGLAAGVRLGVTGGLAGFLVAGMFEWNFGDEELLYFLYVLVGMAWAARRWNDDQDRNADAARERPEPAARLEPSAPSKASIPAGVVAPGERP